MRKYLNCKIEKRKYPSTSCCGSYNWCDGCNQYNPRLPAPSTPPAARAARVPPAETASASETKLAARIDFPYRVLIPTKSSADPAASGTTGSARGVLAFSVADLEAPLASR